MNNTKLIISQQNAIFFIDFDEIIYLQSDNCYTTIYLRGGKSIVASKTLTKLQTELDPKTFIRIGQSFVVNRYTIGHIDKKKKCINLIESHNVGYTIALKNLLLMITQK